MAKSVFTGWKTVTPGECSACGSDSDWACDGRGNVVCSCDPECDESFDPTEAAEVESHTEGCQRRRAVSGHCSCIERSGEP